MRSFEFRDFNIYKTESWKTAKKKIKYPLTVTITDTRNGHISRKKIKNEKELNSITKNDNLLLEWDIKDEGH